MRWIRSAAWIVVSGGLIALGVFVPALLPPAHAQQPTGSVPTVTGSPAGPIVKVDLSISQVKVYAGPSTYEYPAVGVMLGGETAPALGRAGGKDDWIQIYYPGVPGSTAWIYALYVSLVPGGSLPLVGIPATPTPYSTPTIDPTLAAAFIGQQTPTRLPTFTPPPAPLVVPSFNDANPTRNRGVPVGLIILSLGFIGFFGAVISYLRGR